MGFYGRSSDLAWGIALLRQFLWDSEVSLARMSHFMNSVSQCAHVLSQFSLQSMILWRERSSEPAQYFVSLSHQTCEVTYFSLYINEPQLFITLTINALMLQTNVSSSDRQNAYMIMVP